MKKILFLLILTGLISVDLLKSQDSTNYTVAFVPHYAIYGGLRLDVGIKVRNKSWLLLAPNFYMKDKRYENSANTNNTSNNDGELNTLTGFGLDVYHQILINSESDIYTYFAYGAGYQYFTINYSDRIWMPYQENGLTYYDNVDTEVIQTINRMSFNFVIGVQPHITENFYMDFYTGISGKYSLSSYNLPTELNRFSQYMWNYGYSGPSILIGMKLGIRF